MSAPPNCASTHGPEGRAVRAGIAGGVRGLVMLVGAAGVGAAPAVASPAGDVGTASAVASFPRPSLPSAATGHRIAAGAPVLISEVAQHTLSILMRDLQKEAESASASAQSDDPRFAPQQPNLLV